MTELAKLHLDIEQRVALIRENSPDWLCGKGCDNCCRQLAEVPQLTPAEWELLRQGLTTLPREQLAEISQSMGALASQLSRPVACPLLDQSTGACPVYAQRPVACRSYGFYVQRDKGLYCHDIESREAAGTLANVVWGNHDAIDQRLHQLGKSRALTDWFADWEAGE